PGQTQTSDELGVMMQASEDFMVAMRDHNGAKRKAHDEKCEGLQTIKVAQGSSAGKRNRLQQAAGMQKHVGTIVASDFAMPNLAGAGLFRKALDQYDRRRSLCAEQVRHCFSGRRN